METMKKAFNDFVDDKYSDSEESIRSSVKDAINKKIKEKLNLKSDPINIDKVSDDKE